MQTQRLRGVGSTRSPVCAAHVKCDTPKGVCVECGLGMNHGKWHTSSRVLRPYAPYAPPDPPAKMAVLAGRGENVRGAGPLTPPHRITVHVPPPLPHSPTELQYIVQCHTGMSYHRHVIPQLKCTYLPLHPLVPLLRCLLCFIRPIPVHAMYPKVCTLL